MDIVITFVIILVIGLSILPFFLLGGEFRSKRKTSDQGDGPVTPVPTADGAPFLPRKPADSASDDGGDAGDGGDGGTD